MDPFGPRLAIVPSRSNRYLPAPSDLTLAVSEYDDTDSLENGTFEFEYPEFNTERPRSFIPNDSEIPDHRRSRPYEIPVEDEHDSSELMCKTFDADDERVPLDKEESLQNDDESDFEYEYEDDDEGHFTGFILSNANLSDSRADGSSLAANAFFSNASVEGAARIEDEDVVDQQPSPSIQFASLEQTQLKSKTSKWKDPSKEAVSMSLRAEKEATGGRRRLASDLYRIMMQDNEESGFELEPQHEDSMDKWTIRLFKFDEDSSLHEDLLVCR